MGHPPRGAFWLGLAVAVPGVALMSATGDGSAHWIGDLLALVGGMFGAAYFLLGRVARRRVGIGTYASLVCAAAALALLPACLVAGIPLVGFSPSAWGLVLLLALVPQLLGHNGFNYALRYLPTATVTATTLLEPVGATLLAIAVLGELPPVVGAENLYGQVDPDRQGHGARRTDRPEPVRAGYMRRAVARGSVLVALRFPAEVRQMVRYPDFN